ncbi:unnamed protein product [Gongylonema pulchrum]|uniref:GGDEF domain-containing protein n=1 Tax=Gongylonema pulchrum TaxID=637853 RepID=A0A183ER12_9BILA|nr:unnamed protein product [Gongylonema pulchrum]
MEILEQGISRVRCDRRLFLGMTAVFVALILSTLFVEQYLPSIRYLTAIFRFLVALIIAFCLWHGLIGLTMEMKALKASKASIGMLLND